MKSFVLKPQQTTTIDTDDVTAVISSIGEWNDLTSSSKHLLPADIERLRSYVWADTSKRSLLHCMIPMIILALASVSVAVAAHRQTYVMGRLWASYLVLFMFVVIGSIICWLDHQRNRQAKAARYLPDWGIERAWEYTMDQFFSRLLHGVVCQLCSVAKATELWEQVPYDLRIGYGNAELIARVADSPKDSAERLNDMIWLAIALDMLHELDREMLRQGLTNEEVMLIMALLPALNRYLDAGCPND